MEIDHNLSGPLSLQPHLPPHLSKQGKELQTWQSPLAAADSSQGAAGDRAWPSPGRGAQGEEGPAVAALQTILNAHGGPLSAGIVGGCPWAPLRRARVQLQGPAPEGPSARAAVLEGARAVGVRGRSRARHWGFC